MVLWMVVAVIGIFAVMIIWTAVTPAFIDIRDLVGGDNLNAQGQNVSSRISSFWGLGLVGFVFAIIAAMVMRIFRRSSGSEPFGGF